MRQTITAARHTAPELKQLRARCADLATDLFTNPDTAAQEVTAIFGEIPRELLHPIHRLKLEAWLLAEIVNRARRHERGAAERKRESLERAALAQRQHWWRLHRSGELMPLLQRLPAAYAEAFRMHHIEKVSLSEVTRRTGASAGVVTHRIAEAAARLDTLVGCMTAGSTAKGVDC
jgi:DNA-directed RNA polymerase specialized sigma subunit, sigma24 homolog